MSWRSLQAPRCKTDLLRSELSSRRFQREQRSDGCGRCDGDIVHFSAACMQTGMSVRMWSHIARHLLIDGWDMKSDSIYGTMMEIRCPLPRDFLFQAIDSASFLSHMMDQHSIKMMNARHVGLMKLMKPHCSLREKARRSWCQIS